MCTLTLILLFAKILFVAATDNATDNQVFVATTNEPPSALDLILAELKENKQQLQNFEKTNKDDLENFERKTRRQLENLAEANRQQLRILEEANRQQLQILEQANKNQFEILEKRITVIKNAPRDEQLFPINCQQVLENGNKESGIYIIRPETSPKPFAVKCDMDTNGGGWTVLLRKFNISLDYNLSWHDYKFGFGSEDKEFWLGLENLFHLIGFESNELLTEMEDRVHYKQITAHYNFFSIGSEAQGYTLKSVKGYTGNAGDYLSEFEGIKFYTKQRDQDLNTTWNCESEDEGLWYNNCSKFYFDKMQRQIGRPLWKAKVMVRPRIIKKIQFYK